MGNEMSEEQGNNVDAQDFAQFLKERKKKQSQMAEKTEKYNFSPQLKWRNEMIGALQTLAKKKHNQQLCQDLIDVVKRIKMESYIKAISILTAMNSQEILELNTKQVLKESFNFDNCKHSNNVFMDFGQKFEESDVGKESVSTEYSTTASPQKTKNKNLKKVVSTILAKEFNQSYHPIRQLKQSFAMMFQMKFREILNDAVPLTEDKREKIKDRMHSDMKLYCEFITNGSTIYKKWVIKYSKIKEDKYPAFMKGVIMDSLFSGTLMHHSIFPLLKELAEEPVKNMKANIKDNMGIEHFHINPQLQIEGNFVLSLLMLEDMDRLTSPKRLLETLESLKEQICNDIDQYHQLFKTNKRYKIDGDNLLGILCFILCRMKPKLLEVYCQIMLLVIIYGDSVNLIFESASYMITAFQASFEHFQSPDFGK